MDTSYKRHIVKTITWRLIGTIDTIILSWVITGNPFTGFKIGFAEIVTKMIKADSHFNAICLLPKTNAPKGARSDQITTTLALWNPPKLHWTKNGRRRMIKS